VTVAAFEKSCPFCGGKLIDREMMWLLESRVLVAGDKAIRFSPIETRIFDAMFRAWKHGHGLSGRNLLDAMYADRADGGPEGHKYVSIAISKMRKFLGPLRMTIVADDAKSSFYRLVVR
jgi:hypothetical protein